MHYKIAETAETAETKERAEMVRFKVNSEELRKVFKQRKMSIAEGARLSEIPLSTMFKLVHNTNEYITLKTFSRLIAAFGYSVVSEFNSRWVNFVKVDDVKKQNSVFGDTIAQAEKDGYILTEIFNDGEKYLLKFELKNGG